MWFGLARASGGPGRDQLQCVGMDIGGKRCQQRRPRIEPDRDVVYRRAVEARGRAACFLENQQRRRKVEGSHWCRRDLEGDTASRGVTEVERGRTELPDLLGTPEDRHRPLTRFDPCGRIELHQGDGYPVKRGRYGPQWPATAECAA